MIRLGLVLISLISFSAYGLDTKEAPIPFLFIIPNVESQEMPPDLKERLEEYLEMYDKYHTLDECPPPKDGGEIEKEDPDRKILI